MRRDTDVRAHVYLIPAATSSRNPPARAGRFRVARAAALPDDRPRLKQPTWSPARCPSR
jgi:hypothetical protein